MIYNGMIHRALSTLDTSHLHGTSPDSLESDPPLKTHRPTPTPRARPPRAATRLRHGLRLGSTGLPGSQLTAGSCPSFARSLVGLSHFRLDWVVPGADHPTLWQDVPNFTGPSQPCMGAMSHMAGLSQNEFGLRTERPSPLEGRPTQTWAGPPFLTDSYQLTHQLNS